MSIKFEFLPNAGEAILITIDNKFTILMDGGNSHPFRKKFSKLKMPIPKVDMVIVTHIDRDHIGGIIRIFEDEDQLKNIKHLLFNEPERCNLFYEPNDSAEVNGTDGDSLLNLLKKTDHINYIKSIHNINIKLEEELCKIIPNTKIRILSPTPSALEELLLNWNPYDFQKNSDVSAIVENEIIGDVSYLANQKYKLDDSIPNKSSIALLLTHENKNYLLLGDAHIDEITESLYKIDFSHDNPLDVEFVKLSHHGSIRNINEDFLKIIRTNKYIICNPSATSKNLPNKETIAQIAFFGNSLFPKNTKEILLTKSSNVDLDFSEEDHKEFNFKITYENKKLEF